MCTECCFLSVYADIFREDNYVNITYSHIKLSLIGYQFFMEYPLNLKREGGYGVVFFSESKNILSLQSAAENYSQQLDIIIFYKKKFFRHKVLSKYFCLPMSETEIFFSVKFADRKLFPQTRGPWALMRSHEFNG